MKSEERTVSIVPSARPPGVRPRVAVQRMAPYDPAESALSEQQPRIRLDSNENPYGPSPRVSEALARLGRYHQYPDPEQKALRRLIAEYAGADPAAVLVGNGSDELIDLLCRVYLEPGDEVIDCTPTFGMYRFSTELCGGTVVEVPRTADWRLDPDTVLRALSPRTRIIFLASPNNPTGTQEPADAVSRLLEAGVIVVLDEAYIEFSQNPSLAHLAPTHPNLVVLRTFSKWAGLAGLRAGYGIFPAETIGNLWKVKPPFNVNVAAEGAVRASLEDLPLLQERVQWIVQERDRMLEGLAEIQGLTIWPSQTNFLLVQYDLGRSVPLKDYLAASGIAVRTYSHPRLRHAVRISVGLPEHTDALLEACRRWTAR